VRCIGGSRLPSDASATAGCRARRVERPKLLLQGVPVDSSAIAPPDGSFIRLASSGTFASDSWVRANLRGHEGGNRTDGRCIHEKITKASLPTCHNQLVNLDGPGKDRRLDREQNGPYIIRQTQNSSGDGADCVMLDAALAFAASAALLPASNNPRGAGP
jgi:hypothetical protein